MCFVCVSDSYSLLLSLLSLSFSLCLYVYVYLLQSKKEHVWECEHGFMYISDSVYVRERESACVPFCECAYMCVYVNLYVCVFVFFWF